MKLRNGFVSNSSSSSFVIALPKQPRNKVELMDMLYPANKKTGNRRGVRDPYPDSDDITKNVDIDALVAATLVWAQIKEQKPLTKSQIRDEISTGWFEGRPDYPFNNSDQRQIADDYKKVSGGKSIHDDNADPVWRKRYQDVFYAQAKAWEEAVQKAADAYLEQEYERRFKGKKCYRCSFSDNDGPTGCTMEHGNTFYNVPSIKISHH